MGQGDIKERPVIHITIDRIVMNFNGYVGQVINGDVGSMKVLIDGCVEAAEQYIHKNTGQVAGGNVPNQQP